MIDIKQPSDNKSNQKPVVNNMPPDLQETLKQAQQTQTLNDMGIVGFNQIQANKAAAEMPDNNALLNAGSNIQKANNNFVSLDLPSKFVFYDFEDLHIRKLTIRDVAKLTRASTQANYQSFKEAIQGCIDRDIDVLTYGDFRYICYWLRVNSYPSTPITIEWTSKYFNRNVSTILKDDVVTLINDMTKERFKEWQAKGFDVPRMKFSDAFNQQKEDKAETILYQNACYFQGNTWEEKFENMDKYYDEHGLDDFLTVGEFDKEIQHGVEEKVTVLDTKFDVNEYKPALENKIKLVSMALLDMEPGSDDFIAYSLMKEEMENDYLNLTKKLEAGEEVRAEPEKRFLKLGPDELLSPLYG